MRYFVDSIEVSFEELQLTSIDLENSIMHFNFTFTFKD